MEDIVEGRCLEGIQFLLFGSEDCEISWCLWPIFDVRDGLFEIGYCFDFAFVFFVAGWLEALHGGFARVPLHRFLGSSFQLPQVVGIGFVLGGIWDLTLVALFGGLVVCC